MEDTYKETVSQVRDILAGETKAVNRAKLALLGVLAAIFLTILAAVVFNLFSFLLMIRLMFKTIWTWLRSCGVCNSFTSVCASMKPCMWLFEVK